MTTRHRIGAAIFGLMLGAGIWGGSVVAADPPPLVLLHARGAVVTVLDCPEPSVELRSGDETNFPVQLPGTPRNVADVAIESVVDGYFPTRSVRQADQLSAMLPVSPAEEVARRLESHLTGAVADGDAPLHVEIQVVRWGYVFQNVLQAQLGRAPRYKVIIAAKARILDPATSDVLWETKVTCKPKPPKGLARTLKQLTQDPQAVARSIEFAALVCADKLWAGLADDHPR